jgi:3-oxoacyl-[acyl-carrier-protein] synthase III
MYRSCISGIGHHVPDRIVTNKELGAILEVEEEFIVKLTGIQTRRWAENGETVSNLSLQASLKAISQAGIAPEDIGMIIFSSMGSDYQFPGGGCDLQHKLGIAGPPALDIRNACNGFVYGISVADQYIKTGMYEHILLVGAEIQSTSLDLSPKGKNMSILFGDGAGAAVISRSGSDKRGILNTQIYSDGQYVDRLIQEAPSPNDHPRLSKELFDTERIYPFMDGRTVFKHAVTRFPEVIMEALEKEGLEIGDLDLIVPHQANLRISEMVARKLGIDKEMVFSNIERYGNTTSASIPIALSEAVEQGRVSEGKLICLAAFGAGFAWGSALIRW